MILKLRPNNFYITIKPWSVDDCKICDDSDESLWEEWYKNFELSSDGSSCTEIKAEVVPPVVPTEEPVIQEEKPAEAVVKSQQAIAGTSAGLSVASSMLNGGSISGAFSVFNQFQLFILLPLIPKHFPEKVTNYILGLDFAMFSFDFIPHEDIPFFDTLTSWIEFPQKDGYLNEIGMNSGSTFINYVPIMWFILLLVLIHIVVTIIFWTSLKAKKTNWFRRAAKVVFVFFTVNLYIRFILEVFLFVNLSIVSEFKAFDTGSSLKAISLFLWGIFTVCLIIFWLAVIYQYKKSLFKTKLETFWMTKELFAGIKDNKYAKLNTMVYLLVRFVSVMIVIACKDLLYEVKTIAYWFVHLSYTSYFIVIRPFDTVKQNLIETSNQVNCLILASFLLKLKEEEDWKDSTINIYMMIMMSGSFINCLIVSFIISSY